MENIVNFNSEIQPNSIKSGGFNIGVNGTTTDLSDFYTGICPINGGYTIYIDKAENGPSIYTPNNDTELVNITNLLGGSVSSVVESLVWINSQSNMTVVNSNYPSIVTDGLVVNLDAGFVSSYPRNGTSWNDLSGSGNTGNLVNGPTFSSDGGGSIIFDDVDDLCSTSYSLSSERFSLCFWIKVPTALTEFKRLFQVSGNSILVIIDGVKQLANTYNLSGTSLILSEAPGINAKIEVNFLALKAGVVEVKPTTGGGTDSVFFLNDQIMTENYTIPAGKNAGIFGPLTIADGITLTIPDGCTLSIV